MTEPAGEVRYEVRGVAVRLTIDRPEHRNALSEAVLDGLFDGLARARHEHGVRCVVLTGEGDRAFSAGGDLGGMVPEVGLVREHQRRGRIGELLVAVARHPQPVVARVNGLALAGGFGLMLACDLAVAVDDAEFGTPEVGLGLWPFMISAVLARNLPRKVAAEMMLSGRRYSAAEAERWGMVNRVVPRAELDGAVDDLVARLTRGAPLAVELGKEALFRSDGLPLEAALAYLNAMLSVDLQSEDVAEGVSAFLEKRDPRWTGR